MFIKKNSIVILLIAISSIMLNFLLIQKVRAYYKERYKERYIAFFNKAITLDFKSLDFLIEKEDISLNNVNFALIE